MWKNRALIMLALVALIWSGCTEESTKPPTNPPVNPNPPEAFEPIAPDFNPDSAFVYIEKQLSFGPRIPNSQGHIACSEWLAAKFESFGAEVTMQKARVPAWDGRMFNIRNIIASVKPEAQRRIIVSCHWDSRPIADKDPQQPTAPVPGANDGGSGVAVALELARQLQSVPPQVGVDFILFDAEDYGNYQIDDSWCLGSQYWGKNLHEPGYTAAYGINLDMVGAKDARFIKDGYSMRKAASQVDNYWSIASLLGYGIYFPNGNFDMASIDDHFYVMELTGIPMVEVIDRNMNTGEFFPHWHKTTDDIEAIDRATLKAVGQTTLEVLLRE